MQGLTARAKLLTGTKPYKFHYPSEMKEKTYVKQGNWVDVIHDFNSVSPTKVITSFAKVSVNTGKT